MIDSSYPIVMHGYAPEMKPSPAGPAVHASLASKGRSQGIHDDVMPTIATISLFIQDYHGNCGPL